MPRQGHDQTKWRFRRASQGVSPEPKRQKYSGTPAGSSESSGAAGIGVPVPSVPVTPVAASDQNDVDMAPVPDTRMAAGSTTSAGTTLRQPYLIPDPPPKEVLITSVPHGLRQVPREAQKVQDLYVEYGDERAEILTDSSIEGLSQALAGRKAWYFMGHGDAQLQSEHVPAFDHAGRIQSVSIDAVVQTVKPHAMHGKLELIVLNGCCTYELAKALHEQAMVPNVVCWQTRALDGAASLFGQAFTLSWLKQGVDIGVDGRRSDAAFFDARAQVLRETEQGELDNGLVADVQKYALCASVCSNS